MNEELRRQIQERRDEIRARSGCSLSGAEVASKLNELQWVLDLLDAPAVPPAAPIDGGLPWEQPPLATAAEAIAYVRDQALWVSEWDSALLAAFSAVSAIARCAVSLPEEAEPAGICGWRLTEWDRCTRPADHEGACA